MLIPFVENGFDQSYVHHLLHVLGFSLFNQGTNPFLKVSYSAHSLNLISCIVLASPASHIGLNPYQDFLSQTLSIQQLCSFLQSLSLGVHSPMMHYSSYLFVCLICSHCINLTLNHSSLLNFLLGILSESLKHNCFVSSLTSIGETMDHL